MVGMIRKAILSGGEPSQAWRVMLDCKNEFLRDERIKFGNKNYAWNDTAGQIIAEEYYTRFVE